MRDSAARRRMLGTGVADAQSKRAQPNSKEYLAGAQAGAGGRASGPEPGSNRRRPVVAKPSPNRRNVGVKPDLERCGSRQPSLKARTCGAAWACCLLLASPWASARHVRIAQIPNGSLKGCSNCHIDPAGGGPRNPFGMAVENNFLSPPGSAGTVVWGPQLAALDSDGDGTTNGLELQDPGGTWTRGSLPPGTAQLVTNPGEFNPASRAPALGRVGALLLGLGLVVAGTLGRSKRRLRRPAQALSP